MSGITKNHGVKFGAAGLLITLGIVFGDIGTSPLYVMKAIVRENYPMEPAVYSRRAFLHYLDTYPADNRKICDHYPSGR